MGLAKSAIVVALAVALVGGCEPKAATKAPAAADFVLAPPGPVKDVVTAAAIDAAKVGRRLVVYVGASWCEPCNYFVDALHEGALPPSLASLRILKFDNDTDDARLIEANYGGQMIPRFVKPLADGTGSKVRFEGSVKGPEAIGNIVPRLEALIVDP